MPASTISADHGASLPKKHKAACDQCNASKVKCPGGGPACKRCADSSQSCHYSLARRIGKPHGSKNRKTLERLRQAREGNLDNNNSGHEGGDAFIPQNNGTRNDGEGALNAQSERQENEESHDTLQMSNITELWPLSPLSSYPTFPESSQLISTPEQDFLDGNRGGDKSVLHSADLEFPDLEGLERAESRRPWTDTSEDYWNSSSASTSQQLSSDITGTDSPLSTYSHSSVSETITSISLDTVAARVKENTRPIDTHLEQKQPALCRCLRNYADILCKLQTIETCQRPVQIDTLLTCANLVLNIAENQLKCTQCLYDHCVAMQLVMIFQTIFSWSEGQCYPPGTSGLDLRVSLGQHEMTEEECDFVKSALISKALDRITALLKLMISRIECVTLHRRGTQSWGHEGADFWNLQQLVSSLIQSFGILTKKFVSRQSRSRQAAEA